LKKRSAAKPPDAIVFFIDRSLGKIDVPQALRKAGYHCECHDDHWNQTTEDAVWLTGVAAQGWVVLTKDERIRYRPLERRALDSAKVRAFIVICGNVRGEETARILLRAMPKILAVVERQQGPFIYHVYKNSTITRTS
jgi:predicted nuclease of predicted toxin-antitoxin system